MDNLFPYRGRHIFGDVKNCYISNEQLREKAMMIFNQMKHLIRNYTSMKIVGESMYVFTGQNEEAGFTCALLLDSSHFTCHSYSNDGLMCYDLFTCGEQTNSILHQLADLFTVFLRTQICDSSFEQNREAHYRFFQDLD